MKQRRAAAQACPCGSGRPYAACCGRYHSGEPAPDARSLMASRYSAYALGLERYVLETWAEEKRPVELRLSEDPVTWLGLEILGFWPDGDRAQVEFVARGRQGGARAFRMHERSRFERRGGRWIYVDGDAL